ncbi:hypothetical protein [Variovorax sp. V116]|uniref:hypothetical protein n=1 Tax=Variovorax sp. V116 TaxID=3065953 RepID=UPI0034E85262
MAVVTPYHREPAAVLRRCMQSVRAQSHPQVVHYMVADGLPQAGLLAEWPQVRHIVLPQVNANFGCTPRGIGALCALADGADVACFLDADNLFLPGHVASVVQAYAEAQERAGRSMRCSLRGTCSCRATSTCASFRRTRRRARISWTPTASAWPARPGFSGARGRSCRVR